jgi:hypothetical protein
VSTNTGATTKGWVKNNVTGALKSFQFNPESFEYSRNVNYADIVGPGQAYPVTAFVNGNSREFTVELFLFDKPYSGLIDKDYMLFFGKFLTPETNYTGYTRPPDMTFCFGYFVRKCVLTSFNIINEEYDSNLNPVRSRFVLTLRQVGTS